MLAAITSGALQGVDALPVEVEVNTWESGEVKLFIVGLPDAAVKESTARVFSALGCIGLLRDCGRTTINLAPGHLRKEGPLYDLPIALAMLAGLRQFPPERLKPYLVAGELALSGEVRPVKGGLALALLARREGKAGALLPPVTAEEAALVEGLPVYAVRTLDEAVGFMEGRVTLPPVTSPLGRLRAQALGGVDCDFAELKGQSNLRRAIEVAVAGGHNLLVIGPPGAGKSMAAKRIPTLMPEPSLEEFLEVLSIHSAAGKTLDGDWQGFRRPFRAPHHTISDVGLLGGGAIPGPGEISLAHRGVLFLDELPEFRRSVLEVLRQPLEDGTVTISRSAGKVTLPCSFMLVAAMNPCPCGFLGDRRRRCLCSPTQITRYRTRLSGPLLDRIDIHVEAPALSLEEIRQDAPSESSAAIRARVEAARAIQRTRFPSGPAACNARLGHAALRRHSALGPGLGRLLQEAMERLGLSARAYDRILRVARTIADLAEQPAIRSEHLCEAIQYRSLDRLDRP